MAWLALHQTLPKNKKLLKLKRILKIKTPQAVGHLCMLWLWALDNADDGNLSEFSNDDIAEVCEWTKDADTYVKALVSVGFIDDDMCIHDWYEYAGKLVDKRRTNAERMRNAREKKRATEEERAANGVRTCIARDAHVQGLQYSTVQNSIEDTISVTTGGNKNSPTGKKESPEKAPEAMEYYLDKINPMASSTCLQELLEFVDALGDDVCIHAIDVARDERKTGWAFIRAIMQRYKSSGVRSVDDVKQLEMQRQQNQMTKTERLNAMVQKNDAPVSPVLRAAAARIITEKDGEEK